MKDKCKEPLILELNRKYSTKEAAKMISDSLKFDKKAFMKLVEDTHKFLSKKT